MNSITAAPTLRAALQDIQEGLKRYELWLMLGWRDVLSRYRRSRLGPFWITVSMGFVAAVLGTLYSGIMQRPAQEYIPYLVAGFIAWGLISTLVTEGRDAFVSNASAIREIPVPTSVYIFRVLWRNIIVLGHNMIIYVLVITLFRIQPFPGLFLFLPGMFLILLNGVWIAMLIGLLNARSRDLGQMIPYAMRLFFFVTPIIWYAESAQGIRRLFVVYNPFYYLLEILRAPLLGDIPRPEVWGVALVITALGWAVALPLYARWRRQIAFWV